MTEEGIAVVVGGGRDFNEASRIWDFLDKLHASRPIEILATGACPYGGADKHAENWAKSREVCYFGFPAKFKLGGAKEGPIRNRVMIEHVRPHIVIAFPGGRGTASLLNEARKADIWAVDLSKKYKISRSKLAKVGKNERVLEVREQ